MRRKSLWLTIGLVALGVACIVGTLIALLQHEPSYYTRCGMPPGAQRKELSEQFYASALRFWTWIQNGGDAQTGNWHGKFNEAELNCYLAEGFLTSHLADKMLPEGVSEPRVQLEKDRIRLGFRYGKAPWSTIISIEFRVWLAKGETNVVVLELDSLHAGALPVSAHSLLEEISESLRRYGIQVTWHRHEGRPSAALKFQTDQPRPTCQLRQLELKPGILAIFGHSSEPLPGAHPAPVTMTPAGE